MSNEEKILETLDKHGEILEQHTKMLEKQAAVLDQHTKILEEHSRILAQHSQWLETLQLDVSGIKVRLDIDVQRQFNILSEGHQTLLETLAPKDRVQALEDEIAFMKSIIKVLGQDIAELKKAQ